MSVVLDPLALLVLLRGEAEAKKVVGALAGARMSVVNIAEVASHFHKLGMPDEQVDQMLRPLPIDLALANVALAGEVGSLCRHTAQEYLSLGDRFCLALAKRDGLPAWTADRKWKDISDAFGVKVVTVR